MRHLEDYIETGDRQALERFCLTARPLLNSIARRFKIDCYEAEDLVQEAFLAVLTWAEAVRGMKPLAQDNPEAAILAHLRRIQKSTQRHNIPNSRLVVRTEQCEDIPEDDVKARTSGNYDALTLLWAAQSECNGEEKKLLDLLVTGAGYRTLCAELRLNKGAARKRVERFRGRLYPLLFEERNETDCR